MGYKSAQFRDSFLSFFCLPSSASLLAFVCPVPLSCVVSLLLACLPLVFLCCSPSAWPRSLPSFSSSVSLRQFRFGVVPCRLAPIFLSIVLSRHHLIAVTFEPVRRWQSRTVAYSCPWRRWRPVVLEFVRPAAWSRGWLVPAWFSCCRCRRFLRCWRLFPVWRPCARCALRSACA